MCYVDATERCAVSIYCVSFEWPVSPGMKNLLQNNRMMRQPSKRQRSKKKKDTHQIYNKKTTTTTMLRNMRSRSRSKDCINNHFANKGLFEYFISFGVLPPFVRARAPQLERGELPAYRAVDNVYSRRYCIGIASVHFVCQSGSAGASFTSSACVCLCNCISAMMNKRARIHNSVDISALLA